MTGLNLYYDKLARNYTLNWSLALTVIFTLYSPIGVIQTIKYFQHHDSFYLFVGLLNILLGVAGIFQGIHITHAVVRRLVAESSPARPAPISEN